MHSIVQQKCSVGEEFDDFSLTMSNLFCYWVCVETFSLMLNVLILNVNLN